MKLDIYSIIFYIVCISLIKKIEREEFFGFIFAVRVVFVKEGSYESFAIGLRGYLHGRADIL